MYTAHFINQHGTQFTVTQEDLDRTSDNDMMSYIAYATSKNSILVSLVKQD